MTRTILNKKSRKLIWVPDCPSLTFSLLAKVFAKGKMFWYIHEIKTLISYQMETFSHPKSLFLKFAVELFLRGTKVSETT